MTPFRSLKGKEKAIADEAEINPIITYRHLLTNNMGALDPLRVIALCDLDAFYAAAERVRLGLDPETPLAVQQWQGLIAVNYPARTFGISRMETVTEAKKKCPDLVLVHVATYKEGETEASYHDDPSPNTHKVSLDHYRRESVRILKVHQELLPQGAEVEKASIDEAFFDFTVPIKEVILSRYPHLSQVPDDSPEGLDTPLPPPPTVSWAGLGNVVVEKVVAADSPSEVSDLTDNNGSTAILSQARQKSASWHDVALAIGAEFMLKMRSEVKDRLGYTTSAGIARNKVLAKLVASYKKMNQQSILRNSEIPGYLKPMPFQKIRFLGGKLGDALADEYGAKTVGDVLNVSLEEMQTKFGEESIWVYNVLRGIDHTEVKERVASKSMLASKNVRPNVTTAEQAFHWIRVLSSEMSVRLLEARELSPSLWPKTLALGIRQGSEAPRSKQTPFPFSKIITPDIIIKPAERLWKGLVGSSSFKVHNISLGFSGLVSLESGQRGIETFFTGNPSVTSGHPDSGSTKKRKIDDNQSIPDASLSLSFHCSRCKKKISLSARELEGRDSTIALENLRLEHQDYHFAQDLSRTVEAESDPSDDGQISIPKKKRKKPQAKGIARYFSAIPKK